MATYLDRLQINDDPNNLALFGSSLYGICSSIRSTTVKIVTLDAFDGPEHGITVYVKFINGNSASSNIKMQIGTSSQYDVDGSCICDAGDVLAFTFDKMDGGTLTEDATKWRWRAAGTAVKPSTAAPSAVGNSAAIGLSSKYAREDHTHNIELATGDANGQVKVAGVNIDVRGLGNAAYNDSTAFATAAQGVKADNSAQLDGATFTGAVTLSGDPTSNLEAATKKYVDDTVAGIGTPENMFVLLGTIGTNGTISNLPTAEYVVGQAYRVITPDTYAGKVCEIGDIIVAINNGPSEGNAVVNNDWTVIQGNLENAVTAPEGGTTSHVPTFVDNTGRTIQDSGFTIGKSVPSNAVFTDTTYSLTDGTAYTGHSVVTTLSASDDGEILASVSNGVLRLVPGIKFTLGNVGAQLTPNS